MNALDVLVHSLLPRILLLIPSITVSQKWVSQEFDRFQNGSPSVDSPTPDYTGSRSSLPDS